MRALFRHKSPYGLCWVTATLFCLICVLLSDVARAEWGGSLSGSAASSEQDSLRSRSLDQSYTVFTNGETSATLRYSFSGMFRHLQSQANEGPYSWRTEVRPTGSLNWRPGILDVRADAAYRADRDEQGASKLTSRTASVHAQTVWDRLPRLFGSLNWSKNVDDLELVGYDTRSQQTAAGATYSNSTLFTNYEFSEHRTRSVDTGIDRVSVSHSGRADATRTLLRRLVNIQGGYQVNTRAERDQSQISGEILTPVPASGLYGDDLAPEFDALIEAPGLTDGLYGIPASDNFDLGNGTAHNFGLDLGISTTVDHLYLYVDTLGVVPFNWTVWQSTDNLTWTQVGGSQQGVFSSFFQRLEFSFAPLQTRYVKLALSPQLLSSPIEVTELRALVTRTADAPENRTTDQRGDARLRVTPARWFSMEVAGSALRQEGSLLTLAREEDGLQSSLRFEPSRRLDLSARYQWTQTSYTDLDTAAGQTSAAGVALRSRWSRALSTTATIDRGEEQNETATLRRYDHARFDVMAQVLPALRASTQLSYSEDSRFESDDMIFARSVTTTLDGEPTNRSQLSLSHRYETYSARYTAVRKYRASVSARMAYRLTSTIQMSADATASEDPTRTDQSYNAFTSWQPVPKMSFGGSYNRIEGDHTPSSNQYALQAVFNWTPRTELSFSYSLNERDDEADASTSRISLYSRF